MDSSKVVTRTTTTKTSGKKGYGYEVNNLNDSWLHGGDEPNINQLDTLLQDLKSERTISRDKELFELSRNQSPNASASYEYDTIIRDTKQLAPMKSSYYEERSFQNIKSSTPEPKYKKVSMREEYVERKVEGDDEPDFSTSVLKKSNNSSYGRVIPYDEHEVLIPSLSEPKYKTVSMRENIVKQQRQATRDFEPEYSSLNKSSYNESTRSYEKNNLINKNNNNVTTLEQYISPEELEKINISENILPAPGTKVITTVRTYTYEIPGDPATNVSTNKETIVTSNRQNNVIYNDRSRSPLPPPHAQIENYQYSETNASSRNTLPVQKTVSQINKTSHITELDNTMPRNQHPAPGTYRPDQNHVETYYYKDESNNILHPPEIDRTPVVSSYTIRNNTIDRRYIEEPPRGPNVTSYVVHNVNNTIDRNYPDEPPRTTPVTTTYTRHHNVHNNTIDRGYPEEPPQIPSQTAYTTIRNVHNTVDRRYPEPPPHPNTHVTSYKYTSTSSNRGPPNDTSLQPFPVDGLPRQNTNNDKSPTHLNDLLSSFGNENNGDVIDTSYNPKHEVETAVAKRSPPNQQVVPSKNIAGPPVYYPPGHELSLRKEEGGGAWRAQGGYAKGSGRYEYEAESSSKSKSSTKAAVVPVCLPLCCAMPCSIM